MDYNNNDEVNHDKGAHDGYSPDSGVTAPLFPLHQNPGWNLAKKTITRIARSTRTKKPITETMTQVLSRHPIYKVDTLNEDKSLLLARLLHKHP